MKHKIHPVAFDPIIQDLVHRHPNEIKKYRLVKLVEYYPLKIMTGQVNLIEQLEIITDGKFGEHLSGKATVIFKASNVVIKYDNKLYLTKSRHFTSVDDDEFENCHSFGWMYLNTEFSYANIKDLRNPENYTNLVKSIPGLLLDLDYPYDENVLETTDTTTSE